MKIVIYVDAGYMRRIKAMAKKILEVNNLKKYFPIKGGVFNKIVNHVHAVESVSFDVEVQKTFSLVGESGCGKSTTGRAVLRIHEPTSGEIIFNNTNILDLSKEEMRSLRKDMQYIFQDPYSSLNPRMTVEELIAEPLYTHTNLTHKIIDKKVNDILNKIGLSNKYKKRYPHQFSGGQRQRISIARALITNPKLVIADEPVSALDVSIQSQIINLMMELQKDLKLTYVFISHDLNVVRHISDEIGVMYLGRIVERARTEELYTTPLHPYTKALLSAVPSLDPLNKKKQIILKGDVPSPVDPPKGCAFHLRCPKAKEICKNQIPEYRMTNDNHYVACHLHNKH